jgi:hypothetical protein
MPAELPYAFAQLADLQRGLRESGTVYTCLPGRYDDLTHIPSTGLEPPGRHADGTAAASFQ